ncbi:MAG: glycosyltransferase family 39 protein [Blastocatellia bacterium]|nr:glycosyltransferase family 39 protein [Blastocatellia bacterium]
MPIRRLAGDFRSLWAVEACLLPTVSRLFADRRFHASLLAMMALFALFAKLHQGDLAGYDAAVYAHEGKQMLATGRWETVYLNGQPDFDKPPMFVWLEAASMWIFGVSDFAARFPSALLGFGTILLVFALARRLSDSYWLPIWAMLILMTTQTFMRFGMRAMTDAPFAFFFTLGLLLYLKGIEQARWFPGFGLALGAAILMRSFLGLIPLGIALAHMAMSGRMALLRSKCFLAGVALAIGIPLWWFIFQYRIFGDLFLARHFSFTYDNLPLTNGKRLWQFGAGLVQYPRMLLETYWPWFPLMAVGLSVQVRKMIRERDSTGSLLVLWIVGVLLPFSFAEFKWLRYILPVFPAFAILAASTLDAWLSPRYRAGFLKAAYLILFLAMAAMWVNPKYRDRPEEMRRLAPLAESATRPDQKIQLYTERRPRDAHLFQVIWYANRQCELRENFNAVLGQLEGAPGTAAAITDKEIFHAVIGRNAAAHPGIRVLGETERFVCWTSSAPALRAEAEGAPKSTASQGGPNGTF